MTDALFSFGVEGLDSLAKAEQALAQLQRVSQEFKNSDIALAPPTSTEGVDSLLGKLGELRTALTSIKENGGNATEAFAASMGIDKIDAAVGALRSYTAEGKAASASAEALAASARGSAQGLNAQLLALEDVTRGYTSVQIAAMKAAQANEDEAATTRLAAAESAKYAKELDLQAKARIEASKAAQQSTFTGGLDRGLHGRGSTLGSSIGYHVGSQLEYLPGLAAQYAMFAGVSDSFKQISEYQKGQADLNVAMQAQPGGNSANGGYLNSLANVSRAVGENAQQSFDSAAQGIRIYSEEIQKSGDTTGKVAQQIGLATAQAAAQLGVLTGEGQQKATSQLLSIASSFGLGSGQLGQINDAIAYARAHVGGDSAQISAGVQGFSKGAAIAGMNVNETSVLMGLLQARTGDEGGALANRLNRIMQNVGGPAGSKIASQYAGSPVASAEDQRVFRSADSSELQRLAAFADVFTRSDRQSQNQMASALGGPQAGTEVKALLDEWKNTIQPNFNKVDSGAAAGAADKQFGSLMQTVGMQVKQFGADLSNLVNDLARADIAAPLGALVEGLKPLINQIDAVVRVFDELPDAVKAPAMALLEAGAAYTIYNKVKGTSDTEAAAAAEKVGLSFTEASAAADKAIAAFDGTSAAADRLMVAFDELTVASEAAAVAEAETAAGGAGGGGRFGKMGVAAAGGLLIGGQMLGGTAGGIMSEAGTGALLGSFIGPEGTLIGGLAGALAGGISALFKQSAQDAANHQTYGAAIDTASQSIATGDFKGAVADFASAVADLKQHGGSSPLTDDLNYRQGLLNNATQVTPHPLAGLAAPANSATSKGDAVVAGQIDQHQIDRLTKLQGHTWDWSNDTLTSALQGAGASINYGGGLTRHVQNGRGQSITQNIPAHDPAQIDAQINNAVREFVASNHLSTSSALNAAQIGQILNKALPGISAAQITALIPQVQQALSGTSESLPNVLKAKADLEAAAAPQLLAYDEAVRAAAIGHSKTSAWLHSAAGIANAKKMIEDTGGDASLIRDALSHLDQGTINTIMAGIQDAEQADRSMLAMHADIVKALSVAQTAMSAVSSLTAGFLTTTNSMVTGLASQMTGASPGLVSQVQAAQNDLAKNKNLLGGITTALPTITPSAAGTAAPKAAGGAGHQYDYVKSAIAEARAARAGGADIAAAQAALQSAQDQMQHNATGSAAWWRAYASLWQAKQQLVAAEAKNAETTLMLTHDYTDPVVQALAKARTALTVLEQDKKLGFSKEKQHADQLTYNQANEAVTRTKQDQLLQNYQTQEQLGLISHAAYISYLEKQRNIMENTKNRTYDQTQYMYQVEQALKSANDSMNAMWNVGDLSTNGLVYQINAITQVAQQLAALKPFTGAPQHPPTNVHVTVSAPGGYKTTITSQAPTTTTRRTAL